MKVLNVLANLGRYFTLLRMSIARPEKFFMYWRETMRQMNDIGIGSFLIVALIAVFIGAVTAVQFAYQIRGSSIPTYFLGYIVRDIMIIEMAPTFTCLVLAGKVGSNMAAEIGGMRQKEQIDALEIMGVNTAAYLVLPKIIASMTMMPLLVIFAAALGIGGGYYAAVASGFSTDAEFQQGLHSFFKPFNLFMMLVKAFVFSFLMASISCFQGYFVKGGSIELGKASTQAVVFSNVAILFFDYVIAVLLT